MTAAWPSECPSAARCARASLRSVSSGHWRTADDDYAIHNIPNAAKAIRSRNAVDREVIQPLREGGGIDEEVLSAVEEAFNVGVYGSSGTSEAGRQPLLLGLPEVAYLRDKADVICRAHANDAKAAGQSAKELFGKEERGNFKAFRQETALPGGLESALFGRMVTSDPGC